MRVFRDACVLGLYIIYMLLQARSQPPDVLM